LALARDGCDIVVADIDLAAAKHTVSEIESVGRQAIAVKTDVSKSADARAMSKAALDRYGRIDILVNNAGACTPPKQFLEMTEAECDSDIDVNLKGVMNCTRAVLPYMLGRKYGKIVNISSGAGIEGGAITPVYAAAKAGVIAFTKSIAKATASSGVNVNSVAPGLANTGFARQAPPGMLEGFKKNIPLGRLTEPQDIANTIVFLVSDASVDIVGQTLSVDGGMLML
jgi:NAD(P)-dependent dehydrogenase (short-subunit alcohol dehydrogenase family)